jgi:hypothetical protein
VELWRARPGDLIALPVFPGEVTVQDAGLGGRYHATRVDWERPDGMSGSLELGDFTEVRLLATADGVNDVWLGAP